MWTSCVTVFSAGTARALAVGAALRRSPSRAHPGRAQLSSAMSILAVPCPSRQCHAHPGRAVPILAVPRSAELCPSWQCHVRPSSAVPSWQHHGYLAVPRPSWQCRVCPGGAVSRGHRAGSSAPSTAPRHPGLRLHRTQTKFSNFFRLHCHTK